MREDRHADRLVTILRTAIPGGWSEVKIRPKDSSAISEQAVFAMQ